MPQRLFSFQRHLKRHERKSISSDLYCISDMPPVTSLLLSAAALASAVADKAMGRGAGSSRRSRPGKLCNIRVVQGVHPDQYIRFFGGARAIVAWIVQSVESQAEIIRKT